MAMRANNSTYVLKNTTASTLFAQWCFHFSGDDKFPEFMASTGTNHKSFSYDTIHRANCELPLFRRFAANRGLLAGDDELSFDMARNFLLKANLSKEDVHIVKTDLLA